MGLGEALSIGSALAWAIAVIIYKRLGETLPPLPLNLLKNLLVLGMLLLSVLALRTPLPHLGRARRGCDVVVRVAGHGGGRQPVFCRAQ